MSDEVLRTALAGLTVRIPTSAADAAALREEVRAADAALGTALRAAAAQRSAAVNEGGAGS
ncbi:hypothetical protein [Microbacterium sp. H1-D42]|uniref:hypothetical protein n=1 Tax=Microbacterium sp. H1-D42 TaxID=2925844 RepID=UPI001F53D1CA|nr:hypothetical protein [Microbacterium sp. H1-D42]UNK70411.1 hypothetical protein MNR00_14825 [Microbacterium sp. H1-D42]